MNFGQKLKQLIEMRGLSQKDVARVSGRSEASVTGWITKGIVPNGEAILPICKLLGVTPEIMLDDAADIFSGQWTVEMTAKGNEAPQGRKIPLISWVAAGNWTEGVVVRDVEDAERWLVSPFPVGENGYALRVVGDSMTAPFGKTYPDGSIIYVDSDNRSPKNNQPVIAKVVGEDLVTFKIYSEDGERKFLRPLNPQYPAIHEEFRILGVVVGKSEAA